MASEIVFSISQSGGPPLMLRAVQTASRWGVHYFGGVHVDGDGGEVVIPEDSRGDMCACQRRTYSSTYCGHGIDVHHVFGGLPQISSRIFVYVDGVNVETGKDERETMKSEYMKTVKIAIGFLLLMLALVALAVLFPEGMFGFLLVPGAVPVLFVFIQLPIAICGLCSLPRPGTCRHTASLVAADGARGVGMQP